MRSFFATFLLMLTAFLSQLQGSEISRYTLYPDGSSKTQALPHPSDWKVVWYPRYGRNDTDLLYLFERDLRPDRFLILSYLGLYDGWIKWYIAQSHQGDPVLVCVNDSWKVMPQVGDEIHYRTTSSGREWKRDGVDIECECTAYNHQKNPSFNNETKNIIIVGKDPFMLMDVPDVSVADNFWDIGLEFHQRFFFERYGIDNLGWFIYNGRLFATDSDGNEVTLADNIRIRAQNIDHPNKDKGSFRIRFEVQKMEIGKNDRLIYVNSMVNVD